MPMPAADRISVDFRELGLLFTRNVPQAEIMARAEQVAADADRQKLEVTAATVRIFTLFNGAFSNAELDRAEQLARSALEVFQRTGDHDGELDGYANIAQVEAARGDLSKAAADNAHALRIARELGDDRSIQGALFAQVGIDAGRGDLPAAAKDLDEAIRANHVVVPPSSPGAGFLAITRAGLLEQGGDLDRATAALQEVKTDVGLVTRLRDLIALQLAYDRGDFDKGRALGEDLLPRLEANSEKLAAMGARTLLGQIAAESGRWADAEKLAREEMAAEKAAGIHPTLAHVLLAFVLVEGNRLDEARKTLAEVAAVENVRVRYQANIVGALLAAKTGESSKAETVLTDTAANAAAGGFSLEALEARLILGEIQLASGKAAGAKAQLATLEREARARGYGYIVERAHQDSTKN
jgi:ATP/maltotriose-dependent transcriptional regulator MalT